MIHKLLYLAGWAGPPKPTIARSPGWPAARKAHLLIEPECQACGSKELLEVHHILPFHVNAKRELDPSNLITLCERPAGNDHFLVGHLGSWVSWNSDVRKDAAWWRKKRDSRPRPRTKG